ncbi:MAG: histone deacetylase [Anaerolineae bacterium]
MTTAYVFHPIYLEHNLPGHPERKERLERTTQLLKESGVWEQLREVEATPIPQEQLALVHDPSYMEGLHRVAESGGGHLDMDTYVGPRSYDVALMAAGGMVNLVAAVLGGEVENGFALVRPPGHHALANRGMGFCLFNNVALAARYALDQGGLERVLIVDFDVHHGNGTQEIFYEDDQVLYFSTHQYPHYPGTGHWREIGRGRGEGLTVNVPLSAGVGDEGYQSIFDELLYPLAERYRPQLILVSAGYDAHWSDPLASMQLSIAGHANLARVLKSMAEDLCQGRLVFTLEGGYHLEVLAYSILATCQVLLGRAETEDPLGPAPRPGRSVDELIVQLKGLHRLV